MNNITLQVPTTQTLLTKSRKRAKSLGFSSLNEVVRLFLNNFSKGLVNIGFSNKTSDEILTKAEAKRLNKLYKEAEKERKAGTMKAYTNATDLLNSLDQ